MIEGSGPKARRVRFLDLRRAKVTLRDKDNGPGIPTRIYLPDGTELRSQLARFQIEKNGLDRRVILRNAGPALGCHKMQCLDLAGHPQANLAESGVGVL